MKVSAIKAQINRQDRYSVYIDGDFRWGLSGDALLESKLELGQEIDSEQARQLDELSQFYNIYNKTLKYLALRPRSKWELETYLLRKKVSPTLSDAILNKLSVAGYIDDQKFAEAYVHDRRLLRPTSQRRLMYELRQKHIDSSIIKGVICDEAEGDLTALLSIIASKRRLSRYQDDQKLIGYLSRQGFSYSDIKTAMNQLGTRSN